MTNDAMRNAYNEGCWARRAGSKVSSNPYNMPNQFELWGYWRDGWAAEDRWVRCA